MRYYTREEVEDLVRQSGQDIMVFDEWIFGQTCPMIDDEMCYYKDDVDRFISFGNLNKNI